MRQNPSFKHSSNPGQNRLNLCFMVWLFTTLTGNKKVFRVFIRKCSLIFFGKCFPDLASLLFHVFQLLPNKEIQTKLNHALRYCLHSKVFTLMIKDRWNHIRLVDIKKPLSVGLDSHSLLGRDTSRWILLYSCKLACYTSTCLNDID